MLYQILQLYYNKNDKQHVLYHIKYQTEISVI